MPEGDTLHRLAARLSPLLSERVVAYRAVGLSREHVLKGTARVVSVDAYGKHLLIAMTEQLSLRIHLGMRGRCRVRRARRLVEASTSADSMGFVGLVLQTDGVRIEFPHTRDIERIPHSSPHRDGASGAVLGTNSRAPAPTAARLRALGPDLLAPGWSEEVLRRIVARANDYAGSDSVAAVLLNQRVAAGIGNVYKCETLFLESIHPFLPWHRLSTGQKRRLYARARELLMQNLGPERRCTLPKTLPPKRAVTERYYVYRRPHRPCRRCQTPIKSYLQPSDPSPRRTYWCPRCQNACG